MAIWIVNCTNKMMLLCRNDTEFRLSTDEEQNAPKSPARRMPLPYEVNKIFYLSIVRTDAPKKIANNLVISARRVL